MTLRVLVIPEDFRTDRYIAGPLVEAMFAAIGRKAAISVLVDPLLGGVERALDVAALRDEVVALYPMVDLFLLLVDRDGNEHRRARLDRIEGVFGAELGSRRALLAEHAWQELEVWLLAGHADLPSDWSWQELRAESNPKERYYQPYARLRGVWEQPGQGRSVLGPAAARHYDRIRRLAPEVAALEQRVRAWKPT